MKWSRATTVRVCAAAVLVALSLGVANVLAYADRPIVLLGECTHELIYEREGAPDILILGTSRVGRGVDAHIVADQLEAEGVERSVLNLYRPTWGIGDQAERFNTVVEELGAPQLLLVEYSEERDDRYQSFGGNYPTRSTTGWIFEHWNSNSEPIDGRFRDLLGTMSTKFDAAMIDTLSGERVETPVFSGELPATATSQNSDCEPRNRRETRARPGQLERELEIVENRWGDWESRPGARWDLERVDYERYDYFMRQFIADAAEHDVQVIFFRMPDYLEAPLHGRFVDEFVETYGVPLIGAPAPVLEELFDGGMRNVGHAGPEGRATYSTWLGTELASFIAGDR